MRRLIFCLLAIGMIQQVMAQQAMAQGMDGPYLRGSRPYVPGNPSYYRWDGAYGGVQAGASFGRGEFAGNKITGLINGIVAADANISAAPGVSSVIDLSGMFSQNNVGASYGVFVGYNAQWEDAVLGVEINYNHSSLTMSRSASGSTSFVSGPTTYYIDVSGTSSLQPADFGTFRARAGWVYENILPYGFIGLAIARTEATQSATVAYNTTSAISPNTTSATATSSDITTRYGWALGAGVDWMVSPSMFLRAEYEFMDFVRPSDIKLHISTLRGAIGLRF
jgi:opacity protein-like surface antigen